MMLHDLKILWDWNPIKLDCDDHYTTINVINSLSNKKWWLTKKTLCFCGLIQLLVHFGILSLSNKNFLIKRQCDFCYIPFESYCVGYYSVWGFQHNSYARYRRICDLSNTFSSFATSSKFLWFLCSSDCIPKGSP